MERKLKDGFKSVWLPLRWEWVEKENPTHPHGWSWAHASADERLTDEEVSSE